MCQIPGHKLNTNEKFNNNIKKGELFLIYHLIIVSILKLNLYWCACVCLCVYSGCVGGSHIKFDQNRLSSACFAQILIYWTSEYQMLLKIIMNFFFTLARVTYRIIIIIIMHQKAINFLFSFRFIYADYLLAIRSNQINNIQKERKKNIKTFLYSDSLSNHSKFINA